ncbi:MAG: FHA domain-containing protein [Proteobacteria bacterium]|nr:FHA domain-containing protein [Pseudomonadota bacterium]NDC24963.1 FHA domain-containing protein [Pseudomonadota bacterium]NDG27279.1 FHA domain-containing protein [Pseudomonadota bacterium]
MKYKSHPAPQLVVIEGNEKGKVFTLKHGTLILGRSKSDLVIADPRISREHVKLEFNEENGKLFFTDLNSLNGTQLNGTTVAHGELKDGDKLQVGNTVVDCQMALLPESTEELRKEPVLKTQEAEVFSSQAPASDKPTQLGEKPVEPNQTTAFPVPKARPHLRLASRTAVLSLLFLVMLVLFWGKDQNSSKSRDLSTANLDSDITQIRQMLSKGENNQALQKALGLSVQNPRHSELEEVVGDIYVSIQKLEAAIGSYKASIEHGSQSRLVHFKLTKAYLKVGLVVPAQEEIRSIDDLIRKNSSDKDLFIEFANLLLTYPELNQSPERAEIIARALQKEIAPKSTIGYRLEASSLINQKKMEEAVSVYEKALILVPNDQDTLENLTLAKLNLQDLKGAMEVIDVWLKANPHEAKALLAAAYLKFYERDYLGAIPHLQEVLTLLSKEPTAPKRLEALHLMGLVFWEQGQRTEAESYLLDACKLGFEQSCRHQLILTREKPVNTDEPKPH